MTSPPTAPPARDLTRTLLVVLLIGLLIGVSFWILRPFLLPIVWGATIVVATWPLMLKLQSTMRRRGFAVAVMTAAMLLVFIVPLLLAIQAFVDHADDIARWIRAIPTAELPPPPDWLHRIPMVGDKLADQWKAIDEAGAIGLAARAKPFLDDAARWVAGMVGGFGLLTFEFLLTVIVAAIMYANGETARSALVRFGRRLASDRGERVVILAGQAIRAVALGVVVTALAQTLLAGLGLAIAGIPFAAVLTAVILLLCIAQLGPLLVLIPAVVWLYWSGDTVWGTVLLVWSIVVGMMDNVLRPILIKRGADLPLLLIFAGVIGGLLAFGIIGLFVGPVVLAVTYTLLKEWMAEQDRESPSG